MPLGSFKKVMGNIYCQNDSCAFDHKLAFNIVLLGNISVISELTCCLVSYNTSLVLGLVLVQCSACHGSLHGMVIV
jgi:hypothetical protein